MARTQAENKPHAEKQAGEEKMHGDALDTAVSSAGEHESQSSSAKQSAIPAARRWRPRTLAGGPPRRPHDHTKPAGDLRALAKEEEFPREPPQEVSRVGKQHRRQ